MTVFAISVFGQRVVLQREALGYHDDAGWEAFCALPDADKITCLAARWRMAGMPAADAVLAAEAFMPPAQYYAQQIAPDVSLSLGAWAWQVPRTPNSRCIITQFDSKVLTPNPYIFMSTTGV